jgi:hypothetical protein
MFFRRDARIFSSAIGEMPVAEKSLAAMKVLLQCPIQVQLLVQADGVIN